MPTPSVTTIFHLEMLDRSAFRAKAGPGGFRVRPIDPPDAALNRRYYAQVGGDWKWTDRLVWSEADWRRYVHREELKTWVGQLHGKEIGYFELEAQSGGSVEIAYFGLLPNFIGQGLGGALLSAAIEQAWNFPGARRVWVHTCSNDHERALENYQKRGFALFKTEQSPL